MEIVAMGMGMAYFIGKKIKFHMCPSIFVNAM